MKAQDVMTRDVATVPPDATVRDVAHRLAELRISGVPVVSGPGEVLGIVSESDLLRRVELGSAPKFGNWSSVFDAPRQAAEAFAKSHGTKAHDVMARPVVSVQEDAELADIADTMARHGIKRVPVIRNGKLVGIIARSDIVRALGQMEAKSGAVHLGSGIIHETILEAMRREPWLDTSYINVSVHEGIVRASGYVQSEQHREALRVLVEAIPGVERVDVDLKVGLPALTWDGRLERD